MTNVGAGGVVIQGWQRSRRFFKDYCGLSVELRAKVDQKLQDLAQEIRPRGLRFEKLKGHSNPCIYTIHVTGNYKLSFDIRDGSVAFLRRVANHDDINRAP